MSVFRKVDDGKKVLKVKLSELVVEDLERLSDEAKKIDSVFPVDDIVEKALIKAIKQADKELSSRVEAPESVV